MKNPFAYDGHRIEDMGRKLVVEMMQQSFDDALLIGLRAYLPNEADKGAAHCQERTDYRSAKVGGMLIAVWKPTQVPFMFIGEPVLETRMEIYPLNVPPMRAVVEHEIIKPGDRFLFTSPYDA